MRKSVDRAVLSFEHCERALSCFLISLVSIGLVIILSEQRFLFLYGNLLVLFLWFFVLESNGG